MKRPETTSQTAGPYVHIGLAPRAAGFDIFETQSGAVIAGPDTPGQRIRVEGVVLDGAGEPVKDVLLEVWQADAEGRHGRNGDFTGWGRVVCDFDTGEWAFDTIRPGSTDGAPHLALWIVARGINIGLNTRMYFADSAENATDPVLTSLPEGDRATLIAQRSGDTYRFDIRLQGDGETVFFDI